MTTGYQYINKTSTDADECVLYGAGLGPQLHKTPMRASCSEAGAEEPPAAQPHQRLPIFSFPRGKSLLS